MRTRYYKLVMGVAGTLLRHASRVCPVINVNPATSVAQWHRSLESAVKGLCNAKYYETTVAPDVPLSIPQADGGMYYDEEGWSPPS